MTTDDLIQALQKWKLPASTEAELQSAIVKVLEQECIAFRREATIDTGVIDFLTLMNGTNPRRLFFSGAITDSNDVFHISEPAISLALPATNSTNGLQINGYNIDSVDDILFASSRTNTKSGARFVQLESNLGISVGNVNASSITVNPADDTSLLICDNSGKIDIDKLKTNSLKIGNLSIESNEESAVTGYNRLS